MDDNSTFTDGSNDESDVSVVGADFKPKKPTTNGFPKSSDFKADDVIKKVAVPGDRDILKLNEEKAVDEQGLKADEITSAVTNLYNQAFESSDAKFFDAVLALVSRLTGVSAAQLIDPDNLADAMEHFHKNALVINANLKKRGD